MVSTRSHPPLYGTSYYGLNEKLMLSTPNSKVRPKNWTRPTGLAGTPPAGEPPQAGARAVRRFLRLENFHEWAWLRARKVSSAEVGPGGRRTPQVSLTQVGTYECVNQRVPRKSTFAGRAGQGPFSLVSTSELAVASEDFDRRGDGGGGSEQSKFPATAGPMATLSPGAPKVSRRSLRRRSRRAHWPTSCTASGAMGAMAGRLAEDGSHLAWLHVALFMICQEGRYKLSIAPGSASRTDLAGCRRPSPSGLSWDSAWGRAEVARWRLDATSVAGLPYPSGPCSLPVCSWSDLGPRCQEKANFPAQKSRTWRLPDFRPVRRTGVKSCAARTEAFIARDAHCPLKTCRTRWAADGDPHAY